MTVMKRQLVGLSFSCPSAGYVDPYPTVEKVVHDKEKASANWEVASENGSPPVVVVVVAAAKD